MGSDATSTVKILLSASGQAQVVGAFNQISAVVSRLSGVLAVFGVSLSAGAIVNSLVNIAEKAIDTADAMGKTAQKAGQLTEQFSALAASAKKDDVTNEQLVRSSKELAKTMIEEGRGAESLHEEFLQLADQMKRLPDGAARIELANRRLGKSGQEMIPWLSKGREAIKAQMEEAEKLGLVIGPRFAANADQFNDLMSDLRGAAFGLALQITDRLLPEGIKFLQLIKDLTVESGVLSQAVNLVVAIYQHYAVQVMNVYYAMKMLMTYVGTFAGTIAGGRSMSEAHAEGKQEAAAVHAEYKKRIAEIAALSNKQRDETESTAAVNAETEDQRITRLTKILDTERELLDLRIAEKKLLIDQTQGAADQQGFITDKQVQTIRDANTEIEKMIRYKIFLTKQARDGTLQPAEGILPAEGPFGEGVAPFLSDEAARRYNLKDRSTKQTPFIDPNSISEQMSEAMAVLRREFGTTAQAIARSFTDVIGTAINTVSSSISGLIRGTTTWAEALQNIADNVLDAIIQGIVKMGVAAIIQDTAQSTARKANTASEIPGQSVLASLTSITSYGAASVIGIAALVAALGVGIAAASGAFAAGGRPEPGKVALIGERGPELWVPDSRGTIIPNHQLGAFSAGASADGGSDARQPLNIVLSDRRPELKDYLRTAEGESVVLEIVGRNMHRFRV